MKQPETWLSLEMEHGIQLLCRSGLQYRPANAPDQKERAKAWAVAINPAGAWKSTLDTPRFRGIFRAMAAEFVEFPTPADFLKYTRLPSHQRQGVKELPQPEMSEEQVRRSSLARERFLRKVGEMRGPLRRPAMGAVGDCESNPEA